MLQRRTYGTGLLIVLCLVTSAPIGAQAKYVAAFPRDGAIKLQETDLLAFWEVLHEKGKPSPMCQLPLDPK